MPKNIEERVYNDIKHAVQDIRSNGWAVEFNDAERKITIKKSGVVLQVYAKDNLIGYELSLAVAPRYMMQSDTDLYDLNENEHLVAKISKEIYYILAEYAAGSIRIQKTSKKTWYGRVKKGYQIEMKLPSGEGLTSSLPCINRIDIGF